VSPAHPIYSGKILVRHLPPGIGGDDPLASRSIGPIPKWKLHPPKGYQTVPDAARRLGRSETTLYGLCRDGKLEHIKMSWGKTRRVYIATDAEIQG
jgi:excisionase family DNA binding protein